MHAVVTGGGGFVGSHLAEALLADGHTVTVVDDFSAGRRAWVPDAATVHAGDLTDPDVAQHAITPDVDLVAHLASRKAVNDADPRGQFADNTTMVQHVIAAMTDAGVTDLIYTSSSTVYGEAPRPTPEDYAPLEPISAYGASKLAAEGLISVAAHTQGLDATILRFANVVGPRLRGAVVPDFIEKLRADPTELEILGNGRQAKSYLDIDDCIAALRHVYRHADAPCAIYNLGTRTTTTVDRIADIVAAELGVAPTYTYTGGDRGWTGDVPQMRLSIEKLAALGFEPAHSSDQAIERAAADLAAEL